MLGPVGTYAMPTALGKQSSSMKSSAPVIAFSRLPRGLLQLASAPYEGPASRTVPGSRSSTPGPGCYESPGAFGSQRVSSRASQPACSFGRSTRDQFGRQFVSTGMAATQRGREGADPGAYSLPACLGAQPLSHKPTTPATTFARGGQSHVQGTTTLPPASK